MVPIDFKSSISVRLLSFFSLSVLLGIVIPALYPAGNAQAQSIVINEVMSSNGQTISDEDGDYEDWVEIHNFGDNPVNLNGFGLSDDYDRPYRWVFPDTTIEPNGFLLVWASNKDRRIPGAELHTNFAISSDGEEIILTSLQGERLDEFPPISILRDVSAGRFPDGTGEWYFFDQPTPGASNTTEPERRIVAPPDFSHPSGFYSRSFYLQLTHPDPNAIIHYTLDGSKPDTTSPVYTGPIHIFDRNRAENNFANIPTNFLDGARGWREPPVVRKATPVRAAAFQYGPLSKTVITNTYMVETGNDRPYSLPVVFLTTDGKNLFDFEEGIYVPGLYAEQTDGLLGNYDLRGDEWEREASLEIFDETGQSVLAQDIGIRIHGGFTRRFPQKSFRLYARGAYGQTRFNARVFPDLPYDEYNRLILRNSGNDWGSTMFRDAAAQSLVSHLDFDTQAYRPAILFINGEYWGIHNFRERYDRHYLERVYGVDPDNVDILTDVGEVKEGDDLHFRELLDFLSNSDMASDDAYDQTATMMDINNFLDYYAAQIYFANNDWPGNNIDYWRLRVPFDPHASKGHDGRWRWLMFDVDRSLGFGSGYEFNMMDHITEGGPETLILDRLLLNEQFRHDFINRIADLLNSAFQPERIKQVIDSLKNPLMPEIGEHTERWWWPSSVTLWEQMVDNMKNSANNRPFYVREHVRDHFSLGDDRTISVDVSQPGKGKVRVNSLAICSSTPGIPDTPYPWSGTYFGGVPVILTAVGEPGYRVAYWEVNGERIWGNKITLPSEGDVQAKAFFISIYQIRAFPDPALLSKADYSFTRWSPDARAGEYPEHMAFVYMDQDDPGLEASIDGFVTGAYNLESHTRIVGMHGRGFAFKNTSNPDGNPGYPGTRLGGALLALDTRDVESLAVTFSAGTVLPNSMIYHIRLQYRVGNEGPFHNIYDEFGNPVEYQWMAEPDHTATVNDLLLPEELLGKSYVQLFWRYYYTGNLPNDDSGQRAKLNISDIRVFQISDTSVDADEAIAAGLTLHQNYPNPFGSPTIIPFELGEQSHVRLEIFSIDGRRVATLIDGQKDTGMHRVEFDGSGLSSGVYIYRIQSDMGSLSRKMIRL